MFDTRASMSVLIRLLLFLVCLTASARANLGDTVTQIVQRYGKPAGYAEATAVRPFGSIYFRASGFELALFIIDNKEVGARVAKLDKSPLSEADLNNIMADENGPAPWVPAVSNDPSTRAWSRSDKATVLYDQEKHILILTSEVMKQAIHASEAKVAH